MMETSAVKAVVQEHARHLKHALGLQQWTIHFEYARIPEEDGAATGDGTVAAKCWLTPPYRLATIRIDGDHCDNPADVLRLLFHEMLHIVVSPFGQVRELIAKVAPEGVRDVLEHCYVDAMELTISNLECAFLDLGGPAGVVAATRREWARRDRETVKRARAPKAKRRKR